MASIPFAMDIGMVLIKRTLLQRRNFDTKAHHDRLRGSLCAFKDIHHCQQATHNRDCGNNMIQRAVKGLIRPSLMRHNDPPAIGAFFLTARVLTRDQLWRRPTILTTIVATVKNLHVLTQASIFSSITRDRTKP